MQNNLKTKSLHGTLIKIDDCGVVLAADPGTGKSDLALTLIDRGHVLIADDCIDIIRNENKLLGKCPATTQQFLLIHDVGLINIHQLYSHEHTLNQCEINLIILLVSPEQTKKNEEPLQPLMTHRDILGLLIPEIHLPANKNRPLPLLIEILVKNWMLKKTGYNTVKDFMQRKNKKESG